MQRTYQILTSYMHHKWRIVFFPFFIKIESESTQKYDVERKRYRVPNKSNPQTLYRRMNGTKQAKEKQI